MGHVFLSTGNTNPQKVMRVSARCTLAPHHRPMLELLVLALLLWMWVMERRFNSMQVSVRSLTQDIEQLRMTNKPAKADVTQISEVAQVG